RRPAPGSPRARHPRPPSLLRRRREITSATRRRSRDGPEDIRRSVPTYTIPPSATGTGSGRPRVSQTTAPITAAGAGWPRIAPPGPSTPIRFRAAIRKAARTTYAVTVPAAAPRAPCAGARERVTAAWLATAKTYPTTVTRRRPVRVRSVALTEA